MHTASLLIVFVLALVSPALAVGSPLPDIVDSCDYVFPQPTYPVMNWTEIDTPEEECMALQAQTPLGFPLNTQPSGRVYFDASCVATQEEQSENNRRRIPKALRTFGWNEEASCRCNAARGWKATGDASNITITAPGGADSGAEIIFVRSGESGIAYFFTQGVFQTHSLSSIDPTNVDYVTFCTDPQRSNIRRQLDPATFPPTDCIGCQYPNQGNSSCPPPETCAQNPWERVTICHHRRLPFLFPRRLTVKVFAAFLQWHLNHGDTIGPCI